MFMGESHWENKNSWKMEHLCICRVKQFRGKRGVLKRTLELMALASCSGNVFRHRCSLTD